MVIDAHGLDAPGCASHLEGLDDTLKAIERPSPQIGVDVFIGDRGVDLQVPPFADTEGPDGGERWVSAGDEGVPAVDVQQTGAVGHFQRWRRGRGVTRPLQDLDGFVFWRQAFVDVAAGTHDLAVEVHGVAGHSQTQGGIRIVLELLAQVAGVPREGVRISVTGDFDVG